MDKIPGMGCVSVCVSDVGGGVGVEGGALKGTCSHLPYALCPERFFFFFFFFSRNCISEKEIVWVCVWVCGCVGGRKDGEGGAILQGRQSSPIRLCFFVVVFCLNVCFCFYNVNQAVLVKKRPGVEEGQCVCGGGVRGREGQQHCREDVVICHTRFVQNVYFTLKIASSSSFLFKESESGSMAVTGGRVGVRGRSRGGGVHIGEAGGWGKYRLPKKKKKKKLKKGKKKCRK